MTPSPPSIDLIVGIVVVVVAIKLAWGLVDAFWPDRDRSTNHD